MTEERFRSQVLGSQHDRARFSCGVASLDRYFREQARQDQRRSVAVPYVLLDSITGGIAGYYTLSACSLSPRSLPEVLIRKLPHYRALPALLLGRLAVDQGYRGRGAGRHLLMDAFARCLEVSNEVGLIGLVVDAKDGAARAFYERFGFRRFTDEEFRLFLPIDSIRELEL